MSRVEAPDKFKEQLYALYAAYLKVQQPLSADDLGAARSGAELFRKALEQADMSLVQGEAHALWMQYYSALQRDIEKIDKAGNIALAREAFERVSQSMYELVMRIGVRGPEPVILFRCPMAFENRGAIWLQSTDQPRNPYFGAMMLRCQDLIDTLYAGSGGTGENRDE